MLEGVLIVGNVIVVIVRIGEEGIAIGKHIRGADVGRRKQCLVWVFDDKYVLGTIGKVLA
jgi:hypothetical protein